MTTKLIKDKGFEHGFNPIGEVKIIKKGGRYYAFYKVTDDEPLSPNRYENDDIFLVNYHRDFYVESKNIVKKDDIANWYHKETIPQQKEYAIFKLSCLVHSGVWLSLESNFALDPQGWDTSHVGVVLVKKSVWKTKKEQIAAAKSLVDEWNTYLSGDVYGIVQEVFDKNKKMISSGECWGFYRSDYADEEIKNLLEENENG